MIRTGVIGYGLGGMAFHAPLIDAVPELALAAIATARGDEVRSRYPGVAVTDPVALIADPSIRLVAISTPNDTHFPLAEAALKAGKHVVIDKPFTNSVAEGEALIALAAERGLVLAAFHNRRWDGDFLTVQKLVESGRLGDVMLAEFRWDRFRPEVADSWKEDAGPGTGLLADLGPHLIDQALTLFGEPEALSADLAIQREGARADDYFELTLHYGKRRAVLSASRLMLNQHPRFALHGTKAGFVKYGLDPQEPWMKAGGSANDPRYGVEDAAEHGVLVSSDGTRETIVSEQGDYRRFYTGVARAIAEGGVPPVTAADAVLGLRIIELARESLRQGRRVTL